MDNIPVEKNKEYEVEIIDNGCEGEGIAKINGFTIFIKGAIKGEICKILIVKINKSFAFGKLIEVLKKSEYRVESDCTTYKRCGGCNLRHIEYEETLRLKKEMIQNLINKSLNKKINVNDVIGMENPYYYRNKLQNPVGKNKDGISVMGVFASRTHEIIPTENCLIQNKKAQEVANTIFSFIKENDISIYDEKTRKGAIRHIVIKVGVKTNEIMCIIVTNENIITNEKELVYKIKNEFPEVKTIIKNINSKNTNVILGDKNIILYGDGYIYDELMGYKFKISAKSFYQTNPIQTEKLYKKAIEFANLNENDILCDLYCGIGTIGICASNKVKKVYGIEIVQEAIEAAKENAKLNNIDNIEFIAGDVEVAFKKLLEEDKVKPTAIIVDPPRRGLDNVTINKILEAGVRKLVYVSCNPATMVRDIKMLEKEYEIKELQPVDMFPYTSHVECCALLELKNYRPLLNLLAFKIQLCFIKEEDLDSKKYKIMKFVLRLFWIWSVETYKMNF